MKSTTSCPPHEHNFMLIDGDKDATRKLDKDGNTEIYKTLFCSKCGDIKLIRVAVWAKRTQKEGEKPF